MKIEEQEKVDDDDVVYSIVVADVRESEMNIIQYLCSEKILRKTNT